MTNESDLKCFIKAIISVHIKMNKNDQITQ